MDIMAKKLGMDPVELRIKNLVRREQFPYPSALGWQYDCGDYQNAMNKALEKIGYKSCATSRKQSARRSGAARRAN